MNNLETKFYSAIILGLLLLTLCSYRTFGIGIDQRVEKDSIQGLQSANIDGFLDLKAPDNYLSEWGDAKKQAINLMSSNSQIQGDLYTKAVFDQIMIGLVTSHPLSTVSIQIDLDNSGNLNNHDVLITRYPQNNDYPDRSLLEVLLYDEEAQAYISPSSLLVRGQDTQSLQRVLLSTGQIVISEQPTGPVFNSDTPDYGFEASFNPVPLVDFLAVVDPTYQSVYNDKTLERMELNYAIIIKGQDQVEYGFPEQPTLRGNNPIVESYQNDFYKLKFTPSWTLDVGISNVELTQSVQFADNSLRLVKDKETLARVYINHNQEGTNVDVKVELTAQLVSFANGIKALSVPLVLSKVYSAPSTPGPREDPTQSVNFLLPAEWMSSGWVSYDYLIVTAKVSPIDKIDLHSANNEFSRTVQLTSTHNLNIYWINVNNVLSQSFIRDRQSIMERMYPVSTINWIELDASVIGPFVGNDKDLISLLNNVVGQIIYAILNDITYNGQGFVIPDQIIGFWLGDGTKGGISDPAWSWPGRLSFASTATYTSSVTVSAHEVNHNLGDAFWGKHVGGLMPNAQFYGCGVDDPDPLWDAFYNDGEIHALGWDPATGLVDPATSDFMTYCTYRWISDYRWELLINKLSSSTYIPGSPQLQLDQVGTADAGTTVRFISGNVDPQGIISIDPSFEVPGIEPVYTPYNITETPSYWMNVSYNNGSVVAYPIYANATEFEDNQSNNSTDNFSFWLSDNESPSNPGSISHIDFLSPDDTLVYQLSPTDYTTNLDFSIPDYIPRGEEVNISWSDSGTARKPLHYQPQYSHDNATWQNIGVPTLEQSMNTTFTKFPGGENSAYFRVLVTDGFETKIAYAPLTSSISDLAPEVKIQGNYRNENLDNSLLDSNGQINLDTLAHELTHVIQGSTVGFMATAVDPEDGVITSNESFTWKIYDKDNLQIMTMSGTTIQFRIFEAGKYIAEVQVTDSFGNTKTSQIQFTIDNPKRLAKNVFDAFVTDLQNSETNIGTQPDATSKGLLSIPWLLPIVITTPLIIIRRRKIGRTTN